MALKRTAAYAAGICSEQLELCDEATPLKELFAHDPGAEARVKEEL